MFNKAYSYILAHTTKRGYWGSWYYKERYNEVIKVILKYCKEDGFTILDLGCGLGIYGKLLEMYYSRYFYVGFDIDENILKSAYRGFNINYVICDIRKMPFLQRKFKISLCSEVLEHIKSPYRILKNMCEVTYDVIIITFPEERLLNIFKDRHPEHISKIDKNIIIKTLKTKEYYVIKISKIFRSYIPCGILEFLKIPRKSYTEKIVKSFDNFLKKIIPPFLTPHETILIEAKLTEKS